MRNASLKPDRTALALLFRVKLRTALLPEVSMPRLVDELIVPELSMTTPGGFDGPVQVMAVPLVDRAALAATVPLSVPVTDLAIVSLPALTVKLAARTGEIAVEASNKERAARRRARVGRRSMDDNPDYGWSVFYGASVTDK